jgi:hypothetical protein
MQKNESWRDEVLKNTTAGWSARDKMNDILLSSRLWLGSVLVDWTFEQSTVHFHLFSFRPSQAMPIFFLRRTYGHGMAGYPLALFVKTIL